MSPGSSVGRAPDLQAGGRVFDHYPGLMTYLARLQMAISTGPTQVCYRLASALI